MNSNYKKNKKKEIRVLEIVGDSGSGKSELSTGIIRHLSDGLVLLISKDDYHKFNRKQRKQIGITPLNPECTDLNLLEQHIELLFRGKSVNKPSYDHVTGDFGENKQIDPHPFFIIEGLLYSVRKKQDRIRSLRVYLESSQGLQEKWKIRRDVVNRGYDEKEVIKEIESRRGDFLKFIHPQRELADIVISFFPSEYDKSKIGFCFGLINKEHSKKLIKIFSKFPAEYIKIWCESNKGTKIQFVEISPSIPADTVQEIARLIGMQYKKSNGKLFKKNNFLEDNLHNPINLSQVLLIYYWFNFY